RWAAQETPARERQAAEQAELAREHVRSMRAVIGALVAECRTVAVEVPDRPEPTIGRMRELTAGAAQAAASEIERVAAGLEERAAIVKRITSAREKVHVANELAR